MEAFVATSAMLVSVKPVVSPPRWLLHVYCVDPVPAGTRVRNFTTASDQCVTDRQALPGEAHRRGERYALAARGILS
jgi:hypothetical protein